MIPAKQSSVSIIIAVFNAIDTIEECLNSCLEQSYVAREIIVIDGGSTDGTVDVLSEYSDQISYWVSEHDNGIYHAWNKALQVISTDWVAFLGADDMWAETSSLSKMMERAIYPAANFVCAQVFKIPGKNTKGLVLGEPWDYSRMKYRMTVGHGGMLHHVSLFEEYGFFNETYIIAGDYEFLLRAGKKIRAHYLPEVIVNMGSGGVSSTDLDIVHKEGKRALSETVDFGNIYGLIYFLRIKLGYFLQLIARS